MKFVRKALSSIAAPIELSRGIPQSRTATHQATRVRNATNILFEMNGVIIARKYGKNNSLSSFGINSIRLRKTSVLPHRRPLLHLPLYQGLRLSSKQWHLSNPQPDSQSPVRESCRSWKPIYIFPA